MKFTFLFYKNNLFAIVPIIIMGWILISDPQSAQASECPYSNFMIMDGECVNLDPQMKTKKRSKISNPVSELDELTGSTLATYSSLLSLVGGSALGYKFLVRR